MCVILPEVIQRVVDNMERAVAPHDTGMDELRNRAQHLDAADEDLAITMAVYMLGFSGYNGFY